MFLEGCGPHLPVTQVGQVFTGLWAWGLDPTQFGLVGELVEEEVKKPVEEPVEE